MHSMEFVRAISVLAPIVGLLVMGLAITLQSGVSNLHSHHGLRQAAWNLTEAVLLLAGCLVGFLVIQQICAVPMGLLG
jgi:hypothetical protein